MTIFSGVAFLTTLLVWEKRPRRVEWSFLLSWTSARNYFFRQITQRKAIGRKRLMDWFYVAAEEDYITVLIERHCLRSPAQYSVEKINHATYQIWCFKSNLSIIAYNALSLTKHCCAIRKTFCWPRGLFSAAGKGRNSKLRISSTIMMRSSCSASCLPDRTSQLNQSHTKMEENKAL